MLKIKDKAPLFNLLNQDGKLFSLKDILKEKKKVLLYFYPKDNTPGCTTEACGFRDNIKSLSDAGLVIFGVNKDSVASHKKFATKYDLNFDLLSDETGEAVKAYDAWGKKRFMGREYQGILRKSFLINEKGEIEKIYETVETKTHATEVLSDSKNTK